MAREHGLLKNPLQRQSQITRIILHLTGLTQTHSEEMEIGQRFVPREVSHFTASLNLPRPC